MTKENIILAVILALLMTIAITLSFWKEDSGAQFDTEIFALENIDNVNHIIMTRADEVLDCRANTQGFLINDTYSMDHYRLALLGDVLQKVRVQRPLSESQQAAAWELLQTKGTRLQIYAGDELLRDFWAGGDSERQQSYFAWGENEIYLVNVPGYTSYLGALFETGLTGWRSKNVFMNTWRSIMSFTMENFENPQKNFRIEYDDPFFSVGAIQPLDSNRVINYLENLQALRAYQMVDSSYQGDPWLRLTTVDINPSRNVELTLYRGDSLIIGVGDKQSYLFRPQQLVPFVQDEEYFKLQPSNSP